jgi:hypothetical protein
MGCGIIEMLFPIDNFPQRYIEREVDEIELVGTWKITPDSEPRIKAYFEQIQNGDLYWGPIRVPWKTITLSKDGICQIEFEVSWDNENKVLTQPDAGSTCTWKIEKISGYDKKLSPKQVLGLFVRLEHFNEQEGHYYVYYSECYIVEENNELILWSFIGDPTQVEYQDFKKTNQ